MTVLDFDERLTAADIEMFHCSNLGNIYIMDSEKFALLSNLRMDNGGYIVKSTAMDATLLGCRIVIVKEPCFMKGVL